MPESIYKVLELVGTSDKSWEDAVQNVIKEASKTVRDLRIAEIVMMDAKIDKQKIVSFRVRCRVSFKYEGGEEAGD